MKRKAAEVATAKKVVTRGATTRGAAAAATAAALTEVTGTPVAMDAPASVATGSTAATAVTADVDSATGTGIFDRMDVLSCILSFVGPNQYRFVAPISQKFRAAYAHAYNNETTTSMNTFSNAHAKLCLNELKSDNLVINEPERRYRDNPSMISVIGRFAAYCNNLTLLEYLRSEGLGWDVRLCSEAADGGHFDLMKWLHTNGCPWDFWTSWAVAKQGDLEMLKWIIEQGCEGTTHILMTAAGLGHLEMLKWGFDRRDDFGVDHFDDVPNLYDEAELYGHTHITEWLENRNG